ncbi:MAG: carboxypeptidase regulatory-like domain-containing protein, partial [Clostridia bacterium]|nr:carboxypeptidase regulatory-like domain-containing protein [Clostridia bacterium]
MKRIVKTALILLLCTTLILSIVPFGVMANEESNKDLSTQMPVNLTATNSVGQMLTDALNEEMTEQNEGTGNVIYSVDVDGVNIHADIITVIECKLVVGIYTEDQTRLISSASIDVTPDDTSVYLTLEKEPPEYFFVKAFLIDEEDLSPVSAAYNGSIYTKEMQEFLSKSTKDFEEERVVNFDEDTTNNFGVLKDDVVVIEENNSKNVITYANFETDLYIIENIDETVSSMSVGDTFSGTFNGESVIVKIGEISIDGKTATILGADTDLEGVFDYVKLDTSSGIKEDSVDESSCGEGVTFEGYEQPESTKRKLKAVDLSGQGGLDAKFSIDFIKKGNDNVNVRVSGNVKLKLAFSGKIYISLSYKYLEFKFDYSIGGSVSVTGKVGFSVPLALLRIDPVPGICAELKPSFVGEISGAIELSVALLKGTVGFGWYSDTGFANLTSAPKLEAEIKGEITVFIGLRIKPEIKVLEGALCETSLESNLGAEAKATLSLNTSDILSTSVKHDCKKCIKGEIHGKFDSKIEGKLLKNDKWSLSYNLIENKIKISDFYWSVDRGEFGFSLCPHKSYKLSITVVDESGKVIPGAVLSINNQNLQSDKEGKAFIFLADGKYNISASANGYNSFTKTIVIKGSQKNSKIQLKSKERFSANRISIDLSSAVVTDAGDLYMWGDNSSGQLGDGTTNDSLKPKKIMSNIDSVLNYGSSTAAITKTGDLYMWGRNYTGQLGDGTTNDSLKPKKIMSNVKSVSLGGGSTAAVTKTGDLYMWGSNDTGQLGDGTTNDSLKPKKIMSNIESISLGGHFTAAVTKAGDLYMWGSSYPGQLDDGTTNDNLKPKKIMSNVKCVFSDYSGWGTNSVAAITKNNDLFMWGNQLYSDMNVEYNFSSSKPKYIMGNVLSFSMNYGTNTALTYAGDLYIWGTGKGPIYNDDWIPTLNPEKKLSNVVDFKLSYGHIGAVTKSGDLYMWGYNSSGELGDGTTNNSLKPKKIMSSVECLSIDFGVSAAIKESGDMYLWGLNMSGQIGDGT